MIENRAGGANQEVGEKGTKHILHRQEQKVVWKLRVTPILLQTGRPQWKAAEGMGNSIYEHERRAEGPLRRNQGTEGRTDRRRHNYTGVKENRRRAGSPDSKRRSLGREKVEGEKKGQRNYKLLSCSLDHILFLSPYPKRSSGVNRSQRFFGCLREVEKGG